MFEQPRTQTANPKIKNTDIIFGHWPIEKVREVLIELWYGKHFVKTVKTIFILLKSWRTRFTNFTQSILCKIGFRAHQIQDRSLNDEKWAGQGPLAALELTSMVPSTTTCKNKSDVFYAIRLYGSMSGITGEWKELRYIKEWSCWKACEQKYYIIDNRELYELDGSKSW